MSRIAVLLLYAFQLLFSVRQCDSGLVRRIVNGVPHSPNHWPFLVSLRFRGDNSYLELQGLDHLCSGTLIHRQWVLTAAHCFLPIAEGQNVSSYWTAVLGEHNRRENKDTEQIIEVEKIIVHPNFSIFPRYTGDIALVKLRRPAILNSEVKSVVIGRRSWGRGWQCNVSGWGQQDNAAPGEQGYGNGTIVPRIANIHRISERSCLNHYRSRHVLIDSTVYCYEGNGSEPCRGDNGGPVLCNSPESGESVVLGIVSLGRGCNIGIPIVFTRVGHYKPWIKRTMRANPGEGSSNLPRPQPRNPYPYFFPG